MTGDKRQLGLDAVEVARHMLDDADHGLDNAIREARAAGCKWESIGRAAGMTDAAAIRRAERGGQRRRAS